jgi:hypothetical protein
MRAKSILIFVALATFARAQSAPEPYSVKADQLGETLTQWKANNPRSNECDNITVDDRSSSTLVPKVVYCLNWETGQNFTYATAPLLIETAWFYKDSLYRVDMTLASVEGLTHVMTGLREKFGKPVERETTRTQNSFGGTLEQKRFTWTNRLSTLELTYSDTLDDHPHVTFTLDPPDSDATRRAKQTERAKARADM